MPAWTGWEANGVRGTGKRPAIAEQFRGSRALVLGAGRGLWDDLARLLGPAPWREPQGWDVVVVNAAGHHCPFPFAHWFSLHANLLQHFLALHRARRPDWRHVHTHSDKHHPGVEQVWSLENPGGCSGIFAAQGVLAMGYGQVVLAGCGEDGRDHFYDPPGGGGYSNLSAGDVWLWARDHVFKGRVTSLGGRTRAWLGAPDLGKGNIA